MLKEHDFRNIEGVTKKYSLSFGLQPIFWLNIHHDTLRQPDILIILGNSTVESKCSVRVSARAVLPYPILIGFNLFVIQKQINVKYGECDRPPSPQLST